jgi:hypothetical protein
VFWMRKQETALHPSVDSFLSSLRGMDAAAWAFALWAAGRQWGEEGPLSERQVSAAIAADPILAPVIARFASPDKTTRRVIDAAGSARQDSQIGQAMDSLADAFGIRNNPDRAIALLWLGDSLAKLGAVALAHQDQLPRGSVLKALAPFNEVVHVDSLLTSEST